MIFITKASPLKGYKIQVTFSTGENGIADMQDIVNKGVFKKIKNEKNFKNFIVDPFQKTIVWEHGELDIAPESLYFRAFRHKPELQELFQQWGYLDR